MSDSGLVRFEKKHMKELEDMFKLTKDQRNGLDVISKGAANILDTFNWAMYEERAAICVAALPEAQRVVEWIRKYCTDRKIDHDIRLDDGSYYLYLN
ncbi:hypothetical protein [Paenibacillus elgii]|uniref:hypothetical protein n=1 Tax=Paenibacillus elgii TaxID=189691 RepID=UPI0013D3AF0B|nr:hypothetical protein [Paenibacillus elgii]